MARSLIGRLVGVTQFGGSMTGAEIVTALDGEATLPNIGDHLADAVYGSGPAIATRTLDADDDTIPSSAPIAVVSPDAFRLLTSNPCIDAPPVAATARWYPLTIKNTAAFPVVLPENGADWGGLPLPILPGDSVEVVYDNDDDVWRLAARDYVGVRVVRTVNDVGDDVLTRIHAGQLETSDQHPRRWVCPINPDAAYTITATPSIQEPDPDFIGAVIGAYNISDSFAYTLQDQANLTGSKVENGGVDVAIAANTMQPFVWDGSVWLAV